MARREVMRAVVGPTAVLILTLSLAGSAAAQEPPVPQVTPRGDHPKYGKIRLGPLYLTPAVTVIAGVDNNVYNTPTGIADESVAVRPTLTAVLPVTRHARLKGTGSVTPYYFHKEASERHTDLYGTVTAEADIGPVTPFAGIGGGRFRERFSLEIDERLLRRTKSNMFGATVHAGKRVSATGSQTTLTSTFDPAAEVDGASVSRALDRDTMTRRLDLKIPLTRKTALAPWVDVIEDRFLRPASDLPEKVTSERYAAALEFSELAFFNGRLAAGVHHYGGNSGVTPYDGLFLAIDLNSPFVFGTHLQLTSSRDVTYSVTPVDTPEPLRNTYVASSYRADVFIDLPWKLQARTFAAYAESKYLPPQEQGAVNLGRIDHGWIFGGSLLRWFSHHLGLGAIVQRGRRLSPIDGHSYEETLAGLTGEVRF